MNKNIHYRNIPKVDVLMEDSAIRTLSDRYNREFVLESVRSQVDRLREFIGACDDEQEIVDKIGRLIPEIEADVESFTAKNIKRVVNGTGTILHTNLGRAVISQEAADVVRNIVTGYSNLEYDLKEGKRGSRYSHFERIITKITGAEAAMAVNNNAAAVLLILSTFARGKEVIVSRGELVEIGGSFRVPDVMAQSGGTLVEVGTTNKTHPSDYEDALTENTAALLKVHTSNYRIVGFTESVPVEGLVEIGRKHGVPVIEDIGSGVLIDLSKYGLSYEPTVQDSLRQGADIVCFSGDKLLGGPQAGIIVGKKSMIDKIKKHPLTRALRIDKFTAAALECVFHEYIDEERAVKNIPVMRMIARTAEDIKSEAQKLCTSLESTITGKCRVRVEECESQVGGGSLPLERLKSFCAVFSPETMTTASLEKRLRHSDVPVVGRIEADELIIDLRTVQPGETDVIIKVFNDIFC